MDNRVEFMTWDQALLYGGAAANEILELLKASKDCLSFGADATPASMGCLVLSAWGCKTYAKLSREDFLELAGRAYDSTARGKTQHSA